MPREILSLKRQEDGTFGIYIDGKLDEIYQLDEEHPEMAAGILPSGVKTFNACRLDNILPPDCPKFAGIDTSL